jgi:hypothetical protein
MYLCNKLSAVADLVQHGAKPRVTAIKADTLSSEIAELTKQNT